MNNEEDWPDRRHRHDVDLTVDVHYPDGHSRKAAVTNLSLDGCRVHGWFRIGNLLDFDLPRIGRIRGQVRWAIGGEAGIQFLRTEADQGSQQSANG